MPGLERAVAALLTLAVAALLSVTLLDDGPPPSPDAVPPEDAVSSPPPDVDAGLSPPERPLSYGMDVHALDALDAAGVPPDHATLWVGPWNLEDGWDEPQRQVDEMKARGVVPAIHLYYWGDDMTRACFEEGCWSELHEVHKDQATWQTLTEVFVDRFNETLRDWPVILLLETEFNKADVAGYEPLDAALADLARGLGDAFSNATVVLPFGNWNHDDWATWDRAAAQSDHIGIQSLRASTRDSPEEYRTAHLELLDGAAAAQDLFGKPLMIHDLALSSYPEPDHLEPQRDVLEAVFADLDELKALGVKALTYRAWHDDPQKPRDNHFGVAERHWGLTRADGTEKPAARVWVEGVLEDRQAALDLR